MPNQRLRSNEPPQALVCCHETTVMMDGQGEIHSVIHGAPGLQGQVERPGRELARRCDFEWHGGETAQDESGLPRIQLAATGLLPQSVADFRKEQVQGVQGERRIEKRCTQEPGRRITAGLSPN